MCSSTRSRLAVLGSALLAACSLASSAAYAQQRDDAWVITQITAGKFEELRALEKLSDEGVPFAMYWRGTLMARCVFDRCDEQAAWALFLRAAKAGHGWAQAVVFATAISPAEFTQMTAEIGVPKDAYARQVHAVRSILVAGPSQRVDPKARADFVALATTERQLGLLAKLVWLEGVMKRADELRAIAGSGYVMASELVMQGETIRRTSTEQIVERARGGDLGLAAAYCDQAAISSGEHVLPPEILSVCERAAAQGFPGAVRALLRHHHHSKNPRAADYFAGVCDALLAIHCAGDIAEYYGDRRDESADLKAKRELWQLADANALDAVMGQSGLGGLSPDVLRGKTERLRRNLYTLIVRTSLIDEACLTQRVDVATGAIEANPQCRWRKPIAIPAEFLSGAR
jgi:hypothetical protein